MKNLYNSVKPFRFRLTVFGLLCGATLLSLVLLRIRTMFSETMNYDFLVWNLFLAWIPLGLAYLASSAAIKRRHVLIILPAASTLWLLFFPNAPYILTDLMHLGYPKSDMPLWFDTLLLMWFSWTGLLLGILSLFLMHDIVRRTFGRIAGWAFVLGIGALSSLGIYIGRFLRWNSWDILLHPQARMAELFYFTMHPSPRSLIFISVFASFFTFIYITLYAFGLLFQEQAQTKET